MAEPNNLLYNEGSLVGVANLGFLYMLESIRVGLRPGGMLKQFGGGVCAQKLSASDARRMGLLARDNYCCCFPHSGF